MHALYYQLKSRLTTRKSKTIFDDYYKNAINNVTSESKDFSNLRESIPSNRCRVCLQTGAVFIYGNKFTEIITEVLERCNNIHVNENDGFPKYLCTMCFKFIKAAELFRKTAKHVDDILKREVKEQFQIIETNDDHNYSDDDNSVNEKDSAEKWNSAAPKEVKKEKKVKYNSKVTCHICNKVINQSYYKEHVTMHDPDHKKYVCDVCGKSFRLRCAYHNHSLRHRTDFPYKCQFCPYRGRYAELLKTHMRTHTGDYRYMCTECPARFLFKSNLNSHMLKHKEPKFKCDNCKRAFHTKLLLQRHFEADHLGIKNHVCGMCGKAFGYRNAMMKHQRHVHKREKQMFGRVPAYLQASCGNQE